MSSTHLDNSSTSQLRRPLPSVAFPQGVFGDRIARVHGEQPGDAYVEGFLGTRQQARLCSLQGPLRFPERRLGFRWVMKRCDTLEFSAGYY